MGIQQDVVHIDVEALMSGLLDSPVHVLAMPHRHHFDSSCGIVNDIEYSVVSSPQTIFYPPAKFPASSRPG